MLEDEYLKKVREQFYKTVKNTNWGDTPEQPQKGTRVLAPSRSKKQTSRKNKR